MLRVLVPRSTAYVDIDFHNLNDVIELIKADKVLTVFAHYGNTIKENETQLYELINAILDDLEAYSSYHSHNQVDFYINHTENKPAYYKR